MIVATSSTKISNWWFQQRNKSTHVGKKNMGPLEILEKNNATPTTFVDASSNRRWSNWIISSRLEVGSEQIFVSLPPKWHLPLSARKSWKRPGNLGFSIFAPYHLSQLKDSYLFKKSPSRLPRPGHNLRTNCQCNKNMMFKKCPENHQPFLPCWGNVCFDEVHHNQWRFYVVGWITPQNKKTFGKETGV